MKKLSYLFLLLLIACSEPALKLELQVDKQSGQAPLQVEFVISKSTSGALFDPGDGTAAFKPIDSFLYTYAQAGEYVASLSATEAGEAFSSRKTIKVNPSSKTLNLPDLKADVWTQMDPENTICSDGSPYSFFATPGKLNKVVIDFQGGGACWDDFSCSKGTSGAYARNLKWMSPSTFETGDLNGDGIRDVGGLYDREHLKNPIKDWYHVYIPYCTGDVHWGNNSFTYQEPGDGSDNLIHHKGAVNATAVLDWVYKEFEAPETIFVTGCSAGAYGSLLWLPHIAKRYPQADVQLMADCGAGVVNEAFLKDGFGKWNVFEGAWPDFIKDLNPKNSNFELSSRFIEEIYIAIAKAFPKVQLTQFNTMGDGNQIFYYALMNRDILNGEVVPSEATIKSWLARMPTSMEHIETQSPNFRSYLSMVDDNKDLSDGTAHCIIFRPELFDVIEEEKPLAAWLTDLVSGRNLQSVKPVDVPSYEDIFP